MSAYDQNQLAKHLKLRTELEARGEQIPPQLTTEYLSNHFQLSTCEIESRLRPQETV